MCTNDGLLFITDIVDYKVLNQTGITIHRLVKISKNVKIYLTHVKKRITLARQEEWRFVNL